MYTPTDVRNLLGIPNEPMVTGFLTIDVGAANYGSPLLVRRSIIEQNGPQPNNSSASEPRHIPPLRPLRRKVAYNIMLISPMSYKNPHTCGSGKTFVNVTLGKPNQVKVWEEDSFINHLVVDNIDDISELKYIKSIPDVVRERGLVCVVPNNLKVLKDLVLLAPKLSKAYNFSMVHSYITSVLRESRSLPQFFASNLQQSKYSKFVALLFIVDLKYCMPFYDFHNNDGLLYIWRLFITNDSVRPRELSSACGEFSFFISNQSEGINVVDAQKVINNPIAVSNDYIDAWLKIVTTSHPFVPSLLKKSNKKEQKVLQKKVNNKLVMSKKLTTSTAPKKMKYKALQPREDKLQYADYAEEVMAAEKPVRESRIPKSAKKALSDFAETKLSALKTSYSVHPEARKTAEYAKSYRKTRTRRSNNAPLLDESDFVKVKKYPDHLKPNKYIRKYAGNERVEQVPEADSELRYVDVPSAVQNIIFDEHIVPSDIDGMKNRGIVVEEDVPDEVEEAEDVIKIVRLNKPE